MRNLACAVPKAAQGALSLSCTSALKMTQKETRPSGSRTAGVRQRLLAGESPCPEEGRHAPGPWVTPSVTACLRGALGRTVTGKRLPQRPAFAWASAHRTHAEPCALQCETALIPTNCCLSLSIGIKSPDSSRTDCVRFTTPWVSLCMLNSERLRLARSRWPGLVGEGAIVEGTEAVLDSDLARSRHRNALFRQTRIRDD